MKRVIAFVLVLFQAMPVMAQNAPAQQGQVLNLQDADIRVFIQDGARATGTTFIIKPTALEHRLRPMPLTCHTRSCYDHNNFNEFSDDSIDHP